MSVTAVFFDLDETLIENTVPIAELFGTVYADFEDQLGVENKLTFLNNFRKEAPVLWATMFESNESPESQFVDLYQRSILASGAHSVTEAKHLANAMFERYLSLNAKSIRFNPGAVETLRRLGDAKVRTGVITNGIEALQLNKIHSLGIEAMVDTVTVSAQARAHKPHSAVFDLALARTKADRSNAWQIGDHATNDVAGAIRAGLNGVFYNPSGDCIDTAFEDLQESPNHVIQHLQEIEELLELT